MPFHGKRYKFNRMTGAQISDELRAIGLSFGDVAKESGVNETTLQKWIDGHEQPSPLFASWLRLRALPGAATAARERSDEYRIIED